MIHILRSPSKFEQVPKAVSASVQGDELVCTDSFGAIVARYPASSIVLWGHHAAFEESSASAVEATP
jgi:hypothetical protein